MIVMTKDKHHELQHEDLITLETYVQQGKQWILNKFFICENINIFGYLGGGGGFNNLPSLQ